ncbi:hypothetical protein WJX74_005910 [Apatococcus lobatus]|uniref:Uncharacterized protein n=1 Tax=Apatococcus lobatus TaxID=904363 RepID=A0AAW1RSB0_9CHLO
MTSCKRLILDIELIMKKEVLLHAQAGVATLGYYHNAGLVQAATQLAAALPFASFAVLPYSELMTAIINNATQYGLTSPVYQPCYGTVADPIGTPGHDTCSAPATHVYWDSVQPTTAAAKVVAASVAKSVAAAFPDVKATVPANVPVVASVSGLLLPADKPIPLPNAMGPAAPLVPSAASAAPGSAQGPAAVPASAYPQVAFTATLADLSVDTFGPEQQEAFKTALRNSLPSGTDASISLSNIRPGSVVFDAVVELRSGAQSDAAALAAKVADANSLSSIFANSGLGNVAASNVVTTAPTPSPPPPAASPPAKRFNGGQLAGIVIGCVVGVSLLYLAACGALVMHRRQQQKAAGKALGPEPATQINGDYAPMDAPAVQSNASEQASWLPAFLRPKHGKANAGKAVKSPLSSTESQMGAAPTSVTASSA